MAKKEKSAGLPPGFKPIDTGGAMGQWHDFSKDKILQGKVVATGEYKGDYGPQRTLTVQTKTGELKAFSESHQLKAIFEDKKIKGKDVYVQFDGVKSIGKGKKKKTIKLFTAGIK